MIWFAFLVYGAIVFVVGAAYGSTMTRVRLARQLRAETLQLAPACARYRKPGDPVQLPIPGAGTPRRWS